MTPEMEKALRGSIAKWQAIVDGTGVDRGSANCPLCIACGYGNEGIDCTKCPVFEHTGEWYCAHTPYADYDEARNRDAKLKFAKEEVAFLQGLLPEN